MTVCVAGISEDGSDKAIVTATDQMITTGYFGSDKVAMKNEFLHFDWEVLFAADDVAEITPILFDFSNSTCCRIAPVKG